VEEEEATRHGPWLQQQFGWRWPQQYQEQLGQKQQQQWKQEQELQTTSAERGARISTGTESITSGQQLHAQLGLQLRQ